MDNRFDELTKSLAEGVSRREALRRLGGGLAGALLASLGLAGVAQGASARDCSITCSNFYPPGPARAQCNQVCKKCSNTNNLCPSGGGTICCESGHCCNSEFGAICCQNDTYCCFDYDTRQTTCCPNTLQYCCGTACCEFGCCGPNTCC
jgi:hypothetical protein